jgi:hypothetical protein
MTDRADLDHDHDARIADAVGSLFALLAADHAMEEARRKFQRSVDDIGIMIIVAAAAERLAEALPGATIEMAAVAIARDLARLSLTDCSVGEHA